MLGPFLGNWVTAIIENSLKIGPYPRMNSETENKDHETQNEQYTFSNVYVRYLILSPAL